MQKKLKNQRGSVALFVLLSALFFLVVVTSVAVSYKNKEAQIDSQIEKIKTSYEKNAEQIYNDKLTDRTGISVGDYIKYTSPTASITFNDADTGYSNYATTPVTVYAKDTFRVLQINDDRSMVLIGAMTEDDIAIGFSEAKGYNNAVYTLNSKCSDLYKDTSKGITARSIKVEDITDRMIEGTKGDTTAESTGRKKLEKYQDEQVNALTTGTYIYDTDTTKNTVTYQERTNYPDIFQYEAGGLIDNTATTGIIGQSESYDGYGGLTTLANVLPAPTYLTVPYTYYNVSIDVSDFDNTEGIASVYHNMFFETETNYWCASRCIKCQSALGSFCIRIVNNSNFDAKPAYLTSDMYVNSPKRICPVVYIPASAQVIVSTNPKNQTNTNGTLHEVI